MAVLVDGGTASAAEIIAGALKDNGRAVLIGSRTYGKGSVQLIFDLSDGSSLHVTSARWYTPRRLPLDPDGLAPDLPVEPSAEDVANGVDRVLEEASRYLAQRPPNP
jgi:carboxyl-terminal processing protease